MSSDGKARLAVLISGQGSNLQAFIDACASGELQATISVVVSNKPEAAGLDRAARAGIANHCVNHRDHENRESFDQALLDCLQDYRVDLVILAGFMRILTPVFITPFAGRLLNIHPSLLPRYPGLHTHQRALDAGDDATGATVHFVTTELDGGPPILHARVPVLPGDTAATLAQRVVIEEHLIYPTAARWHLQGRLRLEAGKATLDGNSLPPGGLEFCNEMH